MLAEVERLERSVMLIEVGVDAFSDGLSSTFRLRAS